MKRIILFVLTNIAVLIVLSITARLLGVDRFLTQNGLNMGALLVFAAVFGMGGSFISLAMSKWMAKSSVGAVVIDVPQNATERWLVDTVARQGEGQQHTCTDRMPIAHIHQRPLVDSERLFLLGRLRAGGSQRHSVAAEEAAKIMHFLHQVAFWLAHISSLVAPSSGQSSHGGSLWQQGRAQPGTGLAVCGQRSQYPRCCSVAERKKRPQPGQSGGSILVGCDCSPWRMFTRSIVA